MAATVIVLTRREKDVLVCLALGMHYKAIASFLGTSFKTVYNQKLSALGKIGVRKNADLVKWLRTPEAKRTIVDDSQ